MSVLCRLCSLQRDTENYQYIDAKLNTAFSLSILENVSCYLLPITSTFSIKSKYLHKALKSYVVKKYLKTVL